MVISTKDPVGSYISTSDLAPLGVLIGELATGGVLGGALAADSEDDMLQKQEWMWNTLIEQSCLCAQCMYACIHAIAVASAA